MTNTANTSQEDPPGDASVSFVVYIPLKPEARERGRELLLRVIEAMSAEPDFVRTWVHEDMSESDVIVNYETWACTREHFLQHHLQKDYRQAYERALPELLAGERRIVFLREIAAYPGKRD